MSFSELKTTQDKKDEARQDKKDEARQNVPVKLGMKKKRGSRDKTTQDKTPQPKGTISQDNHKTTVRRDKARQGFVVHNKTRQD